MNYAIEMKSDVLISVPSFIKIGTVIRKLIGENTHTNTQTAR
jgi:hypothetical protein